MRVAIYIRTADAPDKVDDRLAELQDTVADRGWTVAAVHIDRIIGTAKGRNRLPGLSALFASVARHEVDTVMVWTPVHLGTSVDSLLDTLAILHRHGVALIAHDQPKDGATVATGGLLTIAGLLVDARRAYRAEAIRAGQLKARALGVRFGRPPVPAGRIEKVRLALSSGKGVRETGRIAGISAAKVSRIRAEMMGAERAILTQTAVHGSRPLFLDGGFD